ncbi:hypothetical protein POM88_052607 [Heracleum sosnowskyi]|uniref:F-box domain-containing protein n=1 Tax=Heracleum sosnowskyi TaxID=360622 RepID=A0AAD8GRB1_9APIA|nr:hypothetical protein POM88_052607 [Heracleum sosnowskyi]
MAPTGRGGRRNTHRRNNPTSSSPITTSTPLPPALIIKILTHIDPKSLARLKCISKSWYALITHPLFIKKHLHINTLSINTHVICNAYNTRYRNTRDFIRDSDTNRNCNKVVSLLRLDKMPVRLVELENGVIKGSCDFSKGISFGEFSKKMVLAGSVNGVVLVMNLGELNERFVGLWNPGINRWKVVKIGRERGCGDDRTCSAYGLGYDEGNDDIRIIRIVTAYVSRAEFFAKCKRAWVKIYSVNRGCWEDVDGEFSFWPSQCHCQFIVKRVPYFVGDDVMPDDPRSNQQNYILAGIDPCTGLYKKVHYPEHFRGDTWVKPFEYQNSVAAIVQCTPGALEEHKIDMYVLDDGNTSWIKMYSIGPFPYLEFHQPQQSFKTGLIVLEELIENNRGPCLYDPKTDLVTLLIGIDNLEPNWSQSYGHSESLVTIEGMELITKDKNKKTKPKKVNRTELLSKDFESALHL